MASGTARELEGGCRAERELGGRRAERSARASSQGCLAQVDVPSGDSQRRLLHTQASSYPVCREREREGCRRTGLVGVWGDAADTIQRAPATAATGGATQG